MSARPSSPPDSGLRGLPRVGAPPSTSGRPAPPRIPARGRASAFPCGGTLRPVGATSADHPDRRERAEASRR
ncbi:MAG: hypothetical protein ACK559_38920 [bacterium]